MKLVFVVLTNSAYVHSTVDKLMGSQKLKQAQSSEAEDPASRNDPSSSHSNVTHPGTRYHETYGLKSLKGRNRIR